MSGEPPRAIMNTGLEQSLLLRMARDNANIATNALDAGMPEMAREHLKAALKEIDLALGNAESLKAENRNLIEA